MNLDALVADARIVDDPASEAEDVAAIDRLGEAVRALMAAQRELFQRVDAHCLAAKDRLLERAAPMLQVDALMARPWPETASERRAIADELERLTKDDPVIREVIADYIAELRA